MRFRVLMILACVLPLLSGCGDSELQRSDRKIRSCWVDVLSQYRQRADLVPKLIQLVAIHAGDGHAMVAELKASLAQVSGLPRDPTWPPEEASLAQVVDAQSALTGALSRMTAFAERDPDLMADASFRDLRAQLDGSEGRVAAARNCLVHEIGLYNAAIGTFPHSFLAMILDYPPQPAFVFDSVRPVSSAPPADFGGAVPR
ncbi:MAG: LemA family protein [Rhodocyclaceae bacterium]|nr:LemA family protein [Rhodocyclaceae bacterium]